MKKEAVTVYCASSPLIDKAYFDVARRLGGSLADAGFAVVCGGGRAGLMAALIEGAADAGGETVGVLPSFMIERGWNHQRLSRLVETASMHQRKQTMASMSRAAIALPGGCGTLEELLEIITWRQLGLFSGHVVILNVNNYYDPLIRMLDRSIEQHFMNPDHRALWHVAGTVEDAVSIVMRPVAVSSFSQKIV